MWSRLAALEAKLDRSKQAHVDEVAAMRAKVKAGETQLVYLMLSMWPSTPSIIITITNTTPSFKTAHYLPPQS